MQAQAFERVARNYGRPKGEIARAGDRRHSMVHPDFVYAGIAVQQAEAAMTLLQMEPGEDRLSDGPCRALQQIAQAGSSKELEKGR